MKTKSKEQVKASLAEFGKKTLECAKRNYLMLGYILVSVLIELTGVAVTSGKFYMTEPWLFLTFIAFVCLISLYLPGHKSRYAVFMSAILLHYLLDFFFVVIFDSNGTVFDYAMISLRRDAMIILESVPVNFAFTFVSAIIISVYGAVGYIFIKKMPAPLSARRTAALTSAILVIVVLCDSLLVILNNYNYNSYDLSYKLYQNETGTYSNKGMIGNMANELARGWWFSKIDGGDPAELTDFIYRETTNPSVMYGKATDYNVVTILCESFEWFTFVCDEELYPNGYAKQIKLRLTDTKITAVPEGSLYRVIVTGKAINNTLYNYRKIENNKGATVVLALYDAEGNEVGAVSDDIDNLNSGDTWEIETTGTCTGRPVSCKIKSATVRTGLKPEPVLFDNAEQISALLRTLYPNLYELYDGNSTAILNNSYSLEKTDISENKSIIGNYPLVDQYINYAYPDNAIPYSLPNMMKNLFDVESNSFHDGTRIFYNRDKHHTGALGFKSYTASEDMNIENEDIGGGELGERNLDSDMFEKCKEQMFPTNRRFNTYVTTITQHGQYAYRENLQEYYDKLDACGLLPLVKDNENSQALRYYCAAGMDLDKAIGIMLDYLKTHTDEDGNPLIDKTIITLFGDHNAYYQGVSNYAKNIYYTNHLEYSKLYRVPVMIKIGNRDLADDGIDRVINKFTCVVDILPTILDLLGITSFSNLNYGATVFDPDNSSVLYSRAYSKFVTDKLYFNSINHIIYKSLDADDDYIADVEKKSLTLLNKISHVNRIFASDYFKGENSQKFYDNVRRESELT